MRPVHLRIGRIGVDRVEPDLVFLDAGVVQRLGIVEMPSDFNPRRQTFGEEMLVSEIRLVLLEGTGLDEGAEVLELLRPFVGQLDHEKKHAAEDCDPHIDLVAGQLSHLQRRPRQHHGDR